MKKWHSVILQFIPLLLMGAWQTGEVYYTESGSAEFTSSVPLHEFTGESDYLTGMIDFEENIVDFYLDLETLKTGNGRRDRDMYETLDVENHPFAEFTGSLQSTFDMNSTDAQEVTAQGEFTIHGVTRSKTVKGTLQRVGNDIRLKAEWVLDITNFDIEPPGILFYKVDKEMDVRINVLLKPTQEENIQG